MQVLGLLILHFVNANWCFLEIGFFTHLTVGYTHDIVLQERYCVHLSLTQARPQFDIVSLWLNKVVQSGETCLIADSNIVVANTNTCCLHVLPVKLE